MRSLASETVLAALRLLDASFLSLHDEFVAHLDDRVALHCCIPCSPPPLVVRRVPASAKDVTSYLTA
jgi:hypothetical protein